MPAATALRTDFTGSELRQLARYTWDANQARHCCVGGDLRPRQSAIHGVVRWRLIDLCQWLWEEFRVSVARQTLSRELRTLGYRKLTARPRHHEPREQSSI